MKDTEIKSLINSWAVISEAFTPSKTSSGLKVVSEREMAELSLVSGRQEYWECVVSLAGYAESKPQENVQIIENVFSGLASDVSSPHVSDFLEYADTRTTISQDALHSATKSLSLVLGSRGVSPLINAITRLEICLGLFPNDPAGFKKCLAKE